MGSVEVELSSTLAHFGSGFMFIYGVILLVFTIIHNHPLVLYRKCNVISVHHIPNAPLALLAIR